MAQFTAPHLSVECSKCQFLLDVQSVCKSWAISKIERAIEYFQVFKETLELRKNIFTTTKKYVEVHNMYFLTFPADFLIPIIFSNLNSNCSDLLDLRNLQEQVKKAFCYQKLF